MSSLAGRLPDFPWDQLAPAGARARAHPGSIVDLSVGTPVDAVAESIQRALREAANAPGYPLTHGTPAFRAAVVAWAERRLHAAGLIAEAVLPTIGSKEFVAGLPLWLGLGPGDVIVIPTLAYPTYAVGAALVGATVVAADDPADWPERVDLVWINSPTNPSGAVLEADALRARIAAARARQAVIASDECYIELGWTTTPTSVLHRDVTGGDLTGVLALHSLSKRSSMAGYRSGSVTGDPALIADLLQVRKHLGLMTPTPVLAAAAAALADDEHAAAQHERYRSRRDRLRPALEAFGLRIEQSDAGLYLWATAGEDCWQTVERLADLGILVAPGIFYGAAGAQHVRVALTATDERIDAAVSRLTASA